eukprot:TRINITY_DN14498_c0_g1_i1.p1 TRINITY_DN14498_c0_g1~~TRINITY_DN14498_c0_g1_i1.p1  ORF type:complete len:140 (+),score=33.66 TRINITY_DN14498_c0_g1_i1:3-422(+)
MDGFLMLNYFGGLESSEFAGRKADFLVVLLFGAALLPAVAFAMDATPLLGGSLVFMNVYIWSYRNSRRQMQMFGMKFYAPYLPWATMAVSVMVGGSIVDELVGLAVGHVCFFLEFVYPRMRGKKYLKAPGWFVALVPNS